MQFSGIHNDQAHEQNSKTIKSINGLFDFGNRASNELQRMWEIAGPKIAKYLMQYKIKIFKGANQYEIHD